MISSHTTGQLIVLVNGSGLWNDYLTKRSEKEAKSHKVSSKSSRMEQAKEDAKVKPHKPFKQMTGQEYEDWISGTWGPSP